MHGSPWFRARAAIKIRRPELGRLGDSGVLIGVLSDVLVLNEFLRPPHNLPHNPVEVSYRVAGILRMRGYMLGEGLRLRRRHIITPMNVFNSATGKSIRIASCKLGERPFLILPHFEDDDLQHLPWRRNDPSLDVVESPFNADGRGFHSRRRCSGGKEWQASVPCSIPHSTTRERRQESPFEAFDGKTGDPLGSGRV